MKILKEYSGLVALVILAIMSVSNLIGGKSALFGTAIDCQAVTCFTTVGVLTSFQNDGATILNGALTLTGALGITGNVALTGNLTVSGTTGLTGTTTAAKPVIVTTANTATSTVAAGCFQLTATSTASPMKLVITSYATTTATFGNGTAAYAVVAMPGNCPNIPLSVF